MRANEPTRVRAGGTRVYSVTDGAAIIAACETIVAEKQYARINGFAVDMFSASAILSVYRALHGSNPRNAANLAKFLALPIERMARVATALIK